MVAPPAVIGAVAIRVVGAAEVGGGEGGDLILRADRSQRVVKGIQ